MPPDGPDELMPLLARQLAPDVVRMDINMPEESKAQGVRELGKPQFGLSEGTLR
jgi:DNA-binding NarL/FixJ family response regulator